LALLIFLFENELLFVLAFESVPSVSMCMLHSLKSIKHGWLPSALAPCQLHAYYFWVYQVCLTCKLTMSSFEMLHVQTGMSYMQANYEQLWNATCANAKRFMNNYKFMLPFRTSCTLQKPYFFSLRTAKHSC
jgi:hypothetical protein